MQKSILERFLNKYNLGGIAENVTWKIENGKTTVRCMSADKHVLAEVSTSKVDLEDDSYSIFETSALRRLISILEDEIKIKPQVTKDKTTGILFTDKTSKITFVLADPSNITEAPPLKKIPPYEVVITLTPELMDKYSRACSALPDIGTFTVKSDGKSVEMILGYTEINSNRVTLTVDSATKNSELDPISFHAKYFRDILLANKEALHGELSISSAGISKITFKLDDFSTTYYLPEIKVED